MRMDLYSRSLLDRDIVPEAARDWNYVDGVLTVELFDDHY